MPPTDQGRMDTRDVIARGAAATFLGHAGKLARPVALALFTRIYGLAPLGTALLVWAYVEIAARLDGLGLDRGLQRWVPAASPDQRPRVVATALLATLATSAAAALIAALALPAVLGVHGGDATAIRVAVLALLPISAVGVTALHAVRGTKQIWALVWARSVVEPFAWLVGGLALASTGGGLAALLGAYVIAMTAVAAVAVRGLHVTFGLRALVRAVRGPDSLPWRPLLAFSIPLGLADAVNLGLQRVDVVAVGLLTGSPARTAAYAVAREVVTALSKIRQGFDQVLAPVAAELHAGSRRRELADAAISAARWGAVIAAPLALVLAVLALGRLIDTATGPTAVLLGMVGRPRLVLFDAVLGLVIAIAGQALLGPPFGLVGVATATSGGLIAVNLAALYWLDRLEHLRPTGGLLVPTALAAIAGAALVLARLVVGAPAPLALALGLAVWLAAYLALALGLGLLPASWNPFRRPAEVP